MKKPAKPSIAANLVLGLLKVLWAVFVVLTPLVGVWVASSLAAYSNGPAGWCVAAGLLLFPGLPLAWEAYANWRRQRRGVTRRFLTFWDRLTLRTLAVNVVFLGALLGTHPESGFVALSTRGDWMLEGRHGPTAEAVRGKLFKAAGGLEWLYRAAHTNPYRDVKEERKPEPDNRQAAETKPAPGTGPGEAKSQETQWPLRAELHPVVVNMPPEAETSIDAVAHYIADRELDPFRRVKALHDWVADRIAYDADAYLDGHVTMDDADPQIVFKNRLGVCAGYAKLLEALGRAAGVDIAYVSGDVRLESATTLAPQGHAWSAARIYDRYYLIDATWNAGHLSNRRYVKAYRTDYLFAPPEVFGLDHLPEEPAWQLRDTPMSRGDFLRQPMLRPGFSMRGLALLSPTRPQVDVKGHLDIEIKNPQHIGLEVQELGGGPCRVSEGEVTRASCDFGAPKTYTVEIFASSSSPEAVAPPPATVTYEGVGQVEVNNQD